MFLYLLINLFQGQKELIVNHKENYSSVFVSLCLVLPMFAFHCLLQILQDYSSYDLTRPMPGLTDDQHRTVIHEGPLRLLEKQGKVRSLQLHLKPNLDSFPLLSI